MTEQSLRDLMSQMTLQEKIGQLVQLAGDCFGAGEMAVGPQQKLGITQETVDTCGSVLNVLGADNVRRIQDQYLERSRLKIPLLFMADVIYGYQTVYPIPLGLGATWNPDLIREDYRLIAEEASADGDMVTFSPPVDIVRDARWGRCLESPGEDPYLVSCYAKAMVEGFQNNWEPGKSIASCVKHFAGYGAPEAGREYNTVDMSERRLRQDYLPGYKAAVDAGCELVMTSFNTIDEIPATANKWLMDDVLRKEWGFDGVIITDYAAIRELIAHGVAKDDYEASRLAMDATVDIDMKTPCYAKQLEPLVKNGEISEEQIDRACWRILKLKNKLGLFEDPYHGCSAEKSRAVTCTEEKLNAARDTCDRSIVLLKNDGILPLSRSDFQADVSSSFAEGSRCGGKKLALIGPYADSPNIIGMWAIHADKSHSVTVRAAMEETLGRDSFQWTAGCDMLDDYSILGAFGNIPSIGGTEMTAEERDLEENRALEIASEADVVVMALGEHMLQSGEGGARTDITLPRPQKELLKKIHRLGKKIVLVLFNGRPLALTDVKDDCDAILEAWFPGTAGGRSICDILFGDYNPSARLTVSFPWNVGQEPLYYAQFNTGRPMKGSSHSSRFTSRYLDSPNEALYPFGFGLSYHTAEYTDLELDSRTFSPDGKITASVKVTNTGDRAGLETVQLYLRDLVGSVVRPVLELKGFRQISLEPGETKTVSFEITEDMLRFYTKDMSYASEPGDFEIYVGPNSRDLLKETFTLISGV